MSKVLITGSTGMLGSALSLAMLEQGIPIRMLIRNKRSQFVIPDKYQNLAEWFQADLNDWNQMEKAVAGCTQIIHAAALVDFGASGEELIENNLRATQNLLIHAQNNSIERFIYISSVAALGRNSESVCTEDDHWNADQAKDAYAYSKYLAELEVWRAMAEGMNGVILNPSQIIGPMNRQNSLFQFIQKIDKGLKYYPSGTSGWVGLPDLVKIIISLLESPICNDRFIVNSHNVSYADIIEKIAKSLERPAPQKEISAFQLQMLLAWTRIKTLFILNPSLNAAALQKAMKKYRYDNSKLSEALSFEFSDLEKSIDEAVASYKRIKS